MRDEELDPIDDTADHDVAGALDDWLDDGWDDEDDEEDDEEVAALAEALGSFVDGPPVPVTEVAARARAEGLTEVDIAAAAAWIAELLARAPDVRVTADGQRAYRPSSVLARATFTHRLTADEHAAGAIEHLPDLVVLAEVLDFDETMPLAGETGHVEFTANDDELRLVGPAGWLARFTPGDLLGVRVASGELHLTRVDDALAPSEPVVAALRAAFDASVTGAPHSLAYATSLLLDLLVDEPGLLDRAGRPLGELLSEAGLTFDLGFLLPAGADAPTALRNDMAARSVLDTYDLSSRCCRRAFATVRRAIDDPTDDAVDVEQVAGALAHSAVSRAAWRYAVDVAPHETPVAVESLAALLCERTGTAQAAGLFLQALGAERSGDIAAAHALVEAALAADPDHQGAAEQHSRDLALVGDLDAAIRVRQRLAIPDDPELDGLRQLRPPRRSSVGRNVPCPCGSGKKFKACCIDKPPMLDPAGHAAALTHKLLVAVLQPEPMVLLDHILEDLAEAYLDEGEVRGDDQIAEQVQEMEHQLARSGLLPLWRAFEDGLAREFQERYGSFLPAAEQAMLADWLARPLALYERVEGRSGRDGRSLRLRDVRRGTDHDVGGVFDPIDIGRRGGSRAVLARLGQVGDELEVIGIPLLVDDEQRAELADILAASCDTEVLVDWWAKARLGWSPFF